MDRILPTPIADDSIPMNGTHNVLNQDNYITDMACRWHAIYSSISLPISPI